MMEIAKLAYLILQCKHCYNCHLAYGYYEKDIDGKQCILEAAATTVNENMQ
jgi:hypothetical protein